MVMAKSRKEINADYQARLKERQAQQDQGQLRSDCVIRDRNFATVVYPESAPDDWQERLEMQRIRAFISPLHDQCVNPDGEIKKPHYHVMIMYDSLKTRAQAQTVFDIIGGVGQEKVQSMRGYARYLCHLDNPEKTRYDTLDVKNISGADYIGAIGLAVDKYKTIGEMIRYCEEQHIHSFSSLLVYAEQERQDWFRTLCDNGTMVMTEYLKSLRWTQGQNQ
jgi:hypothetical protein